MAGVDEPELSDEELLGAATLAKISSRTPLLVEEEIVIDVQDTVEDEIEELTADLDEELEEAAVRGLDESSKRLL